VIKSRKMRWRGEGVLLVVGIGRREMHTGFGGEI